MRRMVISPRRCCRHICSGNICYRRPRCPRCAKCLLSVLSITKHPTFRQIFGIYLITFLVVLPICCVQTRHSLYYLNTETKDTAIKRLKIENTQRLKLAEFVLQNNKSIKQRLDAMSVENNRTRVAITFVTVSRNRHEDGYDPRYLTQSLTSVVSQITSATDLNFSVSVAICNVDDEPKSYAEAHRLSQTLNIKQFVQYVGKEVDPEINRYEKERRDYVFCVRQATMAYNASFYLMLEDDALLRDDTFQVLDNILNFRLVGKVEHAFFIKLFHPDRVLGYINLEVERIPELLSIGCVFGTLLLFLYLHLDKTAARYLYSLWFAFMLYTSLVALCIGRQNLSELRRISPHLYSVTPAPSCCMPAMLFPGGVIHKYVDMLNNVECKKGSAKDLVLQDLIKNSGLKTYYVNPNLVHHIGMYSSLRPGGAAVPNAVE